MVSGWTKGWMKNLVYGTVLCRNTFNCKCLIRLTILVTACVYPPITHWVWDSNAPGWLFQLGFQDFAGSGVVHLTGGVCALVKIFFFFVCVFSNPKC